LLECFNGSSCVMILSKCCFTFTDDEWTEMGERAMQEMGAPIDISGAAQ